MADPTNVELVQWLRRGAPDAGAPDTHKAWCEIAALRLADTAALVKALEFYADRGRYDGPNQRLIGNDPHTPKDQGYLQDVTRDGGDIAREALAKAATS